MSSYRARQLACRERREHERLCRATTVIQRWWRRQRLGQAQRTEYLRMREATVMLQAAWRGYLARKDARVICAKWSLSIVIYLLSMDLVLNPGM